MRKSEDSAGYGAKAFKVMVFYSLIGVILCVVLLLLFAVSISSEIIPEGLMKISPSICGFIGALIAGISSAKILGKALLNGLLQGLCFFVVLYFAGILVFMRIISAQITLSLFLACIIGALLGGLLSAGGKRRRSI